tara:strand:+ start:395 stop:1642 length:1248 start_codon:yes stop_codon:yes gene_type:complete
VPITDDAALLLQAQTAMQVYRPRRLAVAVSGGSDSLATLYLLWHLSRRQGWALHAVTIDHALRAESAAEARGVAQICKGLGVPHDTLVWDHGTVAGNLMDAARRARYGLIARWAAQDNIDHVVLGHTADDQAETFLMGLARGAGLDGLTGMRPFWTQGGVRFVRPLLDQRRRDLRDFLTRQGVPWMDDPSNSNERYHRVKARGALKALKPLGITVDRLLNSIENLRRAQLAMQQVVADTAAAICRESAGELLFDGAAWAQTRPEIQRRLLIAGLQWVSGAEYPPRAAAVARLGTSVAAGRAATLWGCRIRPFADGFRIAREARAVEGVKCSTDALWDGRWQVDGPHAAGLGLRALGADGLRNCKDWRSTGLSRETLVTTPAIWYDDTLISAPIAGFGAGWSARIVAGFSVFVLSH